MKKCPENMCSGELKLVRADRMDGGRWMYCASCGITQGFLRDSGVPGRNLEKKRRHISNVRVYFRLFREG